MAYQHILPIRVYYADTDSGGLVYYATYMRWMEMGRCEFLRNTGIDLRKQQDSGVITVVARANLTYIRPGRYGDDLQMILWVSEVSTVSFKFHYQFVRQEDKPMILVEAETQMVTVESGSFRLMAIPKENLALLQERA